MKISEDIEDAIKEILPPMIVEAVLAEREHCAQVAEAATYRSRKIRAMCNASKVEPCEIAAAIRARK